MANDRSARVRHEPKQAPDVVTIAATVGVIAAGVALFEAALIPGLAIGAAAVLAPNLVAKPLPRLRRGLQALLGATVRRPVDQAADRPGAKPVLAALPKLGIKQALAKTITYRLTVTSLDLGWNYIIIGNLATAAGLSAFSLAVGPVFYFVHETAWNYFGAAAARQDGAPGTVVDLPGRLGARAPRISLGRFTVNRALAKTIVFQTFGTVTDFTVNYVVVADLVTAAILTAPRFVIGPFVYLGHEMIWDYFTAPRKAADPPAPLKLLPAPAYLGGGVAG